MLVMLCSCIRTLEHRANFEKVSGLPGSGATSTSTGYPVTVHLASGVLASGGDVGEGVKLWVVNEGTSLMQSVAKMQLLHISHVDEVLTQSLPSPPACTLARN